jgi:hypothetical protein
VTDWEEKVAFMRAKGVAQASWSAEGKLLSAILGAPPPSERTEQPKTPAEREVDRERRVRDMVLRSGPRLREVPK